ncbi:DUF397 domain-containing protein [Streptomyces albus subsp. chlorinus]|uniref:DUF397 domain-containing protein n=1 Tax=Streptomyces albus TaxID=1888 RepID=UPI0015704448|nr:DUF397 domain-containing protein [Streptomyces albus]NSC23122.1 DUF397 domain-containing protein [Streptomyces albus subsp. chlorinus]
MTSCTIPNASALVGWRKSSYSGNESGSCLEVADGHRTTVPVRDSKNPQGPALVFRSTAWSAFISALSNGHLP